METTKKILLVVGGMTIVALIVLASYLIRQNNEYPIKICSLYRNVCLRAKKVNFVEINSENCAVTERSEAICGDFILELKEGIEINKQEQNE